MTRPIERTRSVLGTKDFLVSLLDSTLTPGVPDAIRQHAKWCLRHYPTSTDLAIVNNCFTSSIVDCPFAAPDMLILD